MNKHNVLFIIALLFLTGMTSCAKSKLNEKTEKNTANTAEKNLGEENISKQEEIVKINPEIEKLNKVLVSMTERCKEAIPNGDPEEFLADLHKVLELETAFPQDDLSLYYLIDKQHKVSETYVPKNLVKLEKNDFYVINKANLYLREDAELALREMAAAAKKDGITLDVSSTYRSYEYQKNLFNYWVSVDGLEEAERESARPGTSQHQLGVAIDFGSIDDSFAETKMGAWMYSHAAEYGWSLSFPKNYEDVTGYRWESWHFRYLGIPAVQFQKKYFNDVQQFMLEFINAWKEEVEKDNELAALQPEIM